MRYTSNVISYSSSIYTDSASRMAFRQPTLGPETDLVYQYCNDHLNSFENFDSVSIFLEPKLDSGFPDIVVVVWDKEKASHWPAARKELLSQDILITHYVNCTGELPVDSLVKKYGVKKASEMMLRLSDARIVDVESDKLLRKPLEESFAIKRLIAIEAKVKDWRKGVDQAVQNTWFAAESYLLLGVLPKTQHVAEYAEKLGVGVLNNNESFQHPHLKSKVGELPVSHASWLFNEWAWRYSNT